MARLTVPGVLARKGADPLVMVTAYDAPSARMASEAGVDMILVGDSLAMVVLGYEDTLSVTTADIAHHTAAVARAKPDCLIVGDLPWMSYHVSVDDTLRNAATLIRAGAQCVKLEGGRKRLAMVEALVDAEIPVMGHIGLTPQSMHAMGGFKVQGKTVEAAQELLLDAKALESAGVFAIVIEGVPDVVAAMITAQLNIPTIGIGAGNGCDGQVLVWHDLLGVEQRHVPKFVRRFSDVRAESLRGLHDYVAATRDRSFPSDAESYHASEEVVEVLGLYGAPHS
jgi:3-methyl-2-oxobutanoate hydroxymethyltransferase